MFRLSGARNAYSNAVSVYGGLSTKSMQGSRSGGWHSRISCSLCRSTGGESILADVQSVRQQSTRTASAPEDILKKKKKYKKRKQYVELLEVGATSSSERKASVNRIRADHLSQIASSSVSLNQLHKLKTIKHQKHSTINKDYEIDYDFVNMFEKSMKKKYAMENEESCALIYTNQEMNANLNDKEFVRRIKESYFNFKRHMIKDQKLKDLSFAINEGLNQEIEMDALLFKQEKELKSRKDGEGAHEIFRKYLHDMSASKTIHKLDIQEKIDSDLEDISEFGRIRSMNHSFEVDEVVEEIEDKLPQKSPMLRKSKEQLLKDAMERKEKTKQKRENVMKVSSEALEQLGKEESLNKLLLSHLQLYCSIGDVQQAHRILKYYVKIGKENEKKPDVTDEKVYNILMQGHADAGNYDRIREVLSWMEKQKLKRDVHTFSAIFQSIENDYRCTDKVTKLKFHLEEMQKQGITPNDLMDKGKLLERQRNALFNAIRRLDPGFEPKYTPPDIDYVCQLLDRLKLSNLVQTERRSEVAGMFTSDEIYKLGEKQIQNELKGFIEIKNIQLSGDPTPRVLKYREKLSKMEEEWRGLLTSALKRNIASLKLQSAVTQSAVTLYPYVSVISIEELIDLMMIEVRKLADGSESYSPSVSALHCELGYSVYNRYRISQNKKNGVLDSVRLLYKEYCKWYAGETLEGIPETYNSRQVWQTLLHRNRDKISLDYEEHDWTTNVCTDLGKFLYSILINEVKIHIITSKKTKAVRKLPAIYKVYRSTGRLSRAELKPHPLLMQLYQKAATPTLRMSTCLTPLVCPPEPWSRAGRNVLGAYLVTPPPLVRMPKNVVSQWKMLEAAPPATLYPPLDSLNQLGEVPWRVNAEILDLQLQVFRSGGSKELDICQPPSALDVEQLNRDNRNKTLMNQRLSVAKAKAEMYSLWCDMLYKLSLANHYREQTFWLPHNLDFRGRVYACCPHLSQLGSDTARALLRFARPEPLGARGFSWLKTHLVNLTGTMKRHTVDERLAYADSIMSEVVDSAERPLDGRRWWVRSEEPWQTLACCMEIAKALKSGSPEEYLCSIPIHQDGSCNGLQHYAALGGDSAGAESVNLSPLPAPQDVYTAVANKVDEMRRRDAAAGHKAAVALEGFVRRKVIKQTVMTTVYGVTRFGARLQIAKQLKDIEDFPKDMIWSCSTYLTSKTFDSLTEMFTATKQIQDWFTECARVIASVCGESVSWVTPLGLPVVQPYHKRRSEIVKKGGVAEHSNLDTFIRPCMMKQKNAFPPNFIHSLDSSHMMLTSLYCKAAGITFISVHDCFWTHPSTVDQMNKICREQFVALHSQPILEDLSRYLLDKYGYKQMENNKDKIRTNQVLAAVPPKGDFKLENVLKSVYFFS